MVIAPGGGVAEVSVAGTIALSPGTGQFSRTGATTNAEAAGQRSSPGSQEVCERSVKIRVSKREAVAMLQQDRRALLEKANAMSS